MESIYSSDFIAAIATGDAEKIVNYANAFARGAYARGQEDERRAAMNGNPVRAGRLERAEARNTDLEAQVQSLHLVGLELERALSLLVKTKDVLRGAALPMPGNSSPTYVLIAQIDAYFSTVKSTKVPK